MMNQQNLFETAVHTEKPETDSLVIGAQQQKPLSKAQQTFNKLTKQVEKLRKDIEARGQELDDCLAFYGSEIHPVEAKQAEVSGRMAKALYYQHKNNRLLSKKERGILKDLIREQLGEAMGPATGKPPDEELKKIFRDVEGMDYDRALKDDFEMMRDEAEAMFQDMGFDFDMSDVEMETFEEDLARKTKEFQEQTKSQREEQQNRRANQKKTAKQLEREAKEKQKEEARQRSISVIYKQLVKALHPDLERDETMKIEKEALMKEAVAAYEKNDLHQLLRLEMLWLNKESDHLDSLSDEKLEIYNQLLKEQARELKMQRDMQNTHPKYQPLLRYLIGMPFRMSTIQILQSKKKELESVILSMESSIRNMSGSRADAELKMIFHDYKTRPPDFFDLIASLK